MKIRKTYVKLLENHPVYTIFNKNKINISYSCFPNMGTITSSHNKHILNSNSTEYWCSCNNRDECPFENKCLTNRIVYRADLITTKLMNTNIAMVSQILHSMNVMMIIKRLPDINHI